jgi:hypothetical protein
VKTEAARKTESLAGIVEGLSIEEYHASDALSNTGLGYLALSPAHYVQYCEEPPEQTAAMARGTAMHAAILEPLKFFAQYAPLPDDCDLRTKAGKEARDAIVAVGKTPLKASEFSDIERMVHEVHGHPTAAAMLAGGMVEASVFWTDTETGVSCRARPDYLDLKRRRAIDVKTLAKGSRATFSQFQRHAFDYAAHRQAAFAMEGLRQIGQPIDEWVLIAIESAAPYGIGVFILDEAAIGLGRNEARAGIYRYAECVKTGVWPGYSPEPRLLSLPSWVKP